MGNIALRWWCRFAYRSYFPESWRVAAKGHWWTEHPKWFYSPQLITHDAKIPILEVWEFGVERGGGIQPGRRCNMESNQVTAEGGNCNPMGREKVCWRKDVYKRDIKSHFPRPFFFLHSPSSLLIRFQHFESPYSATIPILVPCRDFFDLSSCISLSSFLPVLPWQSPTRFPSRTIFQSALWGRLYAATVPRYPLTLSLIVAFDVRLCHFSRVSPLRLFFGSKQSTLYSYISTLPPTPVILIFNWSALMNRSIRPTHLSNP